MCGVNQCGARALHHSGLPHSLSALSERPLTELSHCSINLKRLPLTRQWRRLAAYEPEAGYSRDTQAGGVILHPLRRRTHRFSGVAAQSPLVEKGQ